MKRIYLATAAILLFTILGINYYYNKNLSAPVNDNSASAQTINTSIESAPAASPVASIPPAQTSTDFAQNTSRTYYGYKKKSSTNCTPRRSTVAKAHRKATCNAIVACNVTAPATEVTGAMHSSPIMLDVQITKEYTGNVPKADRHVRTTKMAHKNKRSYNGPGIGFEGGLNQNRFTNNNTSDIGTGNFHAGMLLNLTMGNNFLFQPGLRYIGKGNALQDNFDANAKEKIRLHYIEMPLNLVCQFGNVHDARFMIGAGPYVAYLAGSREYFSAGESGEGDVLNPVTQQYPKDNIQTWDLGADAFIGVQTAEGIFLKAGAEAGMRSIIKNPATGEYSNRNLNTFITAGYIFGGKRK